MDDLIPLGQKSYDLDDLILMEMGVTILKLVGLSEALGGVTASREVKLGKGVTLTFDPPPKGEDPMKRLGEVVKAVFLITSGTPIEPSRAVVKVLRADGWTINRLSVKSPVLAETMCEFPTRELVELLTTEGADESLAQAACR